MRRCPTCGKPHWTGRSDRQKMLVKRRRYVRLFAEDILTTRELALGDCVRSCLELGLYSRKTSVADIERSIVKYVARRYGHRHMGTLLKARGEIPWRFL